MRSAAGARPRSLRRRTIALALLTGLVACTSSGSPSPSGDGPGRGADRAAWQRLREHPPTGSLAALQGSTLAYRLSVPDTVPRSAPVVYLPGWCGDLDSFPDSAALADRIELRCALIAAGARQRWEAVDHAADLAALLTTLDLSRVVLVAHGSGAATALELARSQPGRVERVVAVEALHDLSQQVERSAARWLQEEYLADFESRLRSDLAGLLVRDADGRLVDELAGRMLATPRPVAIASMRAGFAYDWRRALAACTVPIDVLNGDLVPTREAQLRPWLPGARLVVVEGAGHFPQLERSRAFAAALAGLLEG